MTACGWRTAYDGDDLTGYDGSYMVTSNGVSTCWAQNGSGGKGVYAIARCCDFTHLGDVECSGSDIGSASGNDAKVTGECTGNNVLTGCTVRSNYESYDGAYPGATSPISLTKNSNLAGSDVCTAVSAGC